MHKNNGAIGKKLKDDRVY